MNILVTGAAGFIGSNLCRRLLQLGHQVWGVDNFSTSSGDHVILLQEFPNFHFSQVSIESEQFNNFFGNSEVILDQIFHLACPTGVPNISAKKLGEEMLIACSLGTKNVLDLALQKKAKLLFTSSSESYGDPLVSPQSETYTGNVDPLGPRANYEEGKRFSETIVKLYVEKYQVSARMVRLFNVYGPGMDLKDTRVLPRFVTQTIMGAPLSVFGDGSQIRTLCYVDDIINGFEKVMEKGIDGEIYNLGGDEQITVLQLAKRVVQITRSASKIEYLPRLSHDHHSRLPVLDKINGLGWNQQISLDEGLSLMIQDFRLRLTSQDQVGIGYINNPQSASL